jgi:hypothetical protein
MGMATRSFESQRPVASSAPQDSFAERKFGGLATSDFQFWTGASGRSYVHTRYDLIGCPRVPACAYLLVKRDDAGVRTALRIGTVAAEAWSLNLAEIRHRAAQLGANEVHLHLLAGDAATRANVASDLQQGLFAEHSPEPTPTPAYLC